MKAPFPRYGDHDKELEELRAENTLMNELVSDLKQENGRLKEDLATLTRRYAEAQAYIERVDEAIARMPIDLEDFLGEG